MCRSYILIIDIRLQYYNIFDFNPLYQFAVSQSNIDDHGSSAAQAPRNQVKPAPQAAKRAAEQAAPAICVASINANFATAGKYPMENAAAAACRTGLGDVQLDKGRKGWVKTGTAVSGALAGGRFTHSKEIRQTERGKITQIARGN